MANNYHILFDGRMIGERMHGIARHLINLINGLNELAPQNKYTVIINNEKAFDHFGDKVDIVWAKSKFLSPLEFIEIPKIISMLKPDLFHNPSFSPIIPSNTPYIMTIHDLINITESNSILKKLYYNYLVKKACRKAKKVLTVSEFSKTQISELLMIRKNHIEVIYNGVEDKFFKSIDADRAIKVKEKYKLPDEYLLYVGNLKAHKNIKGVIQGYIASGIDIPLVITQSWEEISAKFNFSKKPDNLFCIGSVSGADIHYIFRQARLFVFPSFREGFGIPVLEAFASGIPVLTSSVSSIPEITQGYAIEVDPTSINSIADGIKKGLYDEELKERNVEFGKQRAAFFTVRSMANRVLDVYDDILHEAPTEFRS